MTQAVPGDSEQGVRPEGDSEQGVRPEGDSGEAVATGRQVLRTAAAALGEVADNLGQSFADAVALIGGMRGRVVVVGMGKSGHIARKIAATLASTDTPALFVHPAEASHGDLGMVVDGDCILALSNSGETSELSDIIMHAKRFSIPLVAMTSAPDSTLARAADLILELPKADEAGQLRLAPTTSTTMMMALGDALAVALLERHGLTAERFGQLHPGGQLGRMLLRVADVMHSGDDMPLIELDPPMGEALVAMASKRFGCIGVVDGEGKLVGMITDGDLRRHAGQDLLSLRASQVMTRTPLTTAPQALAAEVLAQLNARRVIAMFALDGERPVGIVHVHDILHAGVA